jgi:hypothetical protein
MPSFFIIAFIWRGLIFPGSMCGTPLPYFYGYSIIKCKHLRARNLRCAAGNKPVVASSHQHIIPGADLRIRGNDMPGERIFSLIHKFRNIITDYNPVTWGSKKDMKAPCTFDAERQSPVRGPDSSQAHAPVQDLADPAGRREDKLATFREESGPNTQAELVISDDLNPAQQTVLRVFG